MDLAHAHVTEWVSVRRIISNNQNQNNLQFLNFDMILENDVVHA